MPDISPGIEYPKEKPWLTSRNNNEKGEAGPKAILRPAFSFPTKKHHQIIIGLIVRTVWPPVAS